ncbi:MAG: DUF2608 domain-containing protein [Pseudomonadota bacterium]|nr:DUF2608 domain-containing protein [Pseudomonadota bacterium]MEC8977684.1 DUF2608 domain-containing protein [Pseudomonadota bacterium]
MKMKFLIMAFCMLYVKNCHAEIIKADNFDVLAKEVTQWVSKDSLVLFDVDDVLISPTDAFDFRNKIRKDLKKEISEDKSKRQVQVMFSDFFLKRKVKLVNKDMPKLLGFLKNAKIPTTALSAWWTGSFGTIEQMEKQRLKELDQVQISFADLSPFKKDMRFASHKTESGGTPLVIEGIILTALADKGEVLGLVLKKSKYKFKRIIFIDDQMKYLKEVESFCRKQGVDFFGVHYTESASAPVPELDLLLEKSRFNILKQEHVWLSDDELEARL